VCNRLASSFCSRRRNHCHGLYDHRLEGNGPARLGVVHCRSRIARLCCLLHYLHPDKPEMARRFNLTLARFGFAVSSLAPFCSICLMKNRFPVLIAALLISNGILTASANGNPTPTAEPIPASPGGSVQRQNIPQWVVGLFSAKKLDAD